MITENQIYAESERQFPVPVQTGPIPVSREDVDKAQELQDAFVRGAEWMYQASLADAVERLTREKEGAYEAGFDKGVSEAHKRLRDFVQDDGMIDQHALIKHPVYNPKFYPGEE